MEICSNETARAPIIYNMEDFQLLRKILDDKEALLGIDRSTINEKNVYSDSFSGKILSFLPLKKVDENNFITITNNGLKTRSSDYLVHPVCIRHG